MKKRSYPTGKSKRIYPTIALNHDSLEIVIVKSQILCDQTHEGLRGNIRCYVLELFDGTKIRVPFYMRFVKLSYFHYHDGWRVEYDHPYNRLGCDVNRRKWRDTRVPEMDHMHHKDYHVCLRSLLWWYTLPYCWNSQKLHQIHSTEPTAIIPFFDHAWTRG